MWFRKNMWNHKLYIVYFFTSSKFVFEICFYDKTRRFVHFKEYPGSARWNNVREVVVKPLKVVIFIGYIWSESWSSCFWDELTPSACDFWFVLPCISSCCSIFAVVRYHYHVVSLLPLLSTSNIHVMVWYPWPEFSIIHIPIIPVTAHLRVQICSAGLWYHGILCFHILGISSSQLTNSIIFQRGRAQPPTRGYPI